MSLVTTRAGRNVEVRGTGITWPPIPSYVDFQALMSSSGVPVTLGNALGIVSVGVAIKFIAETVGSLPLCVYQGEDADKEKARDSWQWRLLYETPNPDTTAFDFRSDIAACVESCGNAFVRKFKAPTRLGSEVLALYVLNPADVLVKHDERNRIIYEVGPPGQRETLTSAQILHVRGFTPNGGDVGISPISQYTNALGTALASQEFQGRYYANDATPSSYLSVPGRLNRQQAREMKAIWESTHGGSANAGKLGILFDGAELKVPGVPLKDAQFIESQEFSSELCAKIFLGPAASLLGSDANVKTEEESLRFLNFALLPRLRRMESAFYSDPDLFPDDDESGGLYPEFHVDEFLRADAATRSQVLHNEVQSGVLLIDEARAEKGLPPLPDGLGQIPQITPVGGAPNPALAPATTPPPEE